MALAGRIVENILCACGRVFSRYVSASNGWKCLCDCGRECDPSQRAGSRPRDAVKVKKDWEGKDARSLRFAFDPENIEELKREIPDLELNTDKASEGYGDVVWKNDAHQKRVYAQMAAWAKRIEEKEAAEMEREGREGASPAIADPAPHRGYDPTEC